MEIPSTAGNRTSLYLGKCIGEGRLQELLEFRYNGESHQKSIEIFDVLQNGISSPFFNHVEEIRSELQKILEAISSQAALESIFDQTSAKNINFLKVLIAAFEKATTITFSAKDIRHVVSNLQGIDHEPLQGRKKENVQLRQAAMVFARVLTQESLAIIGEHIGGKDHATVLHAIKTINNLLETSDLETEKIMYRVFIELYKRYDITLADFKEDEDKEKYRIKTNIQHLIFKYKKNTPQK